MAQTPAVRYADGWNVDYTPAGAVTAGDVIVINDIPHIANLDIAANALGALATGGLFRVPKSTGSIADRAPVYWNPTGSPVTGTASSGAATGTAAGGKLMGYAVGAAASGDSYVTVMLGARVAGGFGRTPINADVAAAGSVQGDAAQVYEGFTVVTGADATKGVILPTAVAGMKVEIKNGAAAVLKVYGATGAAINAGAANAALSVPASTPVTLIAKTATQWYSFPLVPS